MLLLIELSQFKFIKTTAKNGLFSSNPDLIIGVAGVKSKVGLPLFEKTAYKIRLSSKI